MIYSWMKEIWGKILWDWCYGFLGLFKIFVKLLILVLSLIKKVIGYFGYGEIVYDVIKVICEK